MSKFNPTAWLDDDKVAAGFLLLPALVLLSLFLFLPILYLLGLSFTGGSFTQAGVHWLGLRNYQRLVSDPDFWQVLRNTVY